MAVTWRVTQDGRHFYVIPEVNGEEQPQAVITYPHQVKDFDLAAAEEARRWFLKYIASTKAKIAWD
jgi:hypothetical protein